MFVLITGVDKK